MSKALKKAVKGIKKAFKRIVKTVKKIVKSKVFKVVALAVAVYFGGAALGAWGGGAGGGAAGSVAGAGTAGSATSGYTSTLFSNAGLDMTAGQFGGLKAAFGGTVSNTAAVIPAATTGMTTGQAMLASTALGMGGSMLQAKGDADAAKEERKRRDKELAENNATYLNIYEDTKDIMQRQGVYTSEANQTQVDSSGNSVYAKRADSPMQRISDTPTVPSTMQRIADMPTAPQNVEAQDKKFFNTANNKWQKVP